MRGSTMLQDYPEPPSPGCLSWCSCRADDPPNCPRASVTPYLRTHGLTLCLHPLT